VASPKLSLGAIRRGARSLRDFQTRVLPPKLREAIALHVSAVNECPVCSSVHDRIAARLGISAEEMARARAGDGSDPREQLALDYAAARTLDREDVELTRRFREAFNELEQREVNAVIDRMTFNNAFNNTWEGVLPGAAQRRSRFR
jgi:AhpD family alkylhydroperoxidase